VSGTRSVPAPDGTRGAGSDVVVGLVVVGLVVVLLVVVLLAVVLLVVEVLVALVLVVVLGVEVGVGVVIAGFSVALE